MISIPMPRRSRQLLAGFAISTVVAAFPSAATAQSFPQPAATPQVDQANISPASISQPGSDALATQPAQRSLSDLVGPSDGLLRVSDRPTLVFSFEEQTVLSPREQIEQNKPENSNAIHFPLGDR